MVLTAPSGDLAAVRRGLRLTRVVLGAEPVPSLAVADHVRLPGEDEDLDRLFGVGNCGRHQRYENKHEGNEYSHEAFSFEFGLMI
jgi:hypothetical protein